MHLPPPPARANVNMRWRIRASLLRLDSDLLYEIGKAREVLPYTRCHRLRRTAHGNETRARETLRDRGIGERLPELRVEPGHDRRRCVRGCEQGEVGRHQDVVRRARFGHRRHVAAANRTSRLTVFMSQSFGANFAFHSRTVRGWCVTETSSRNRRPPSYDLIQA